MVYFSQWGQHRGEGSYINGSVGGVDGKENGVQSSVTAWSSVYLEHRNESGKPAVTLMGTCLNYIRIP